MWALREYLVDISPNNSSDQVLIVGAHAIEFSDIKVIKAIWISDTINSSVSDGLGNVPVLISV